MKCGMIKILVIGDSHIPNRARQIPDKIQNKINELTENDLFNYTFFTGDLVKAPNFLQFLKEKTQQDLFIVMGNMDYHFGNNSYPIFQEIELKDKAEIKIGMTHGAQINPRGDHHQIELLAKEKKYNIIITGHTHKEEIFLTSSGILILNPGSVTGAWSFLASGNPSFIIMEIDDFSYEIKITLFRLIKKKDELNEERFNYQSFNNQICNLS